MSASENAQEQTEDRERMVAKWMIKGQAKRGKPITISKSFLGKVGEDPTSFLENLVIDAEVNGWDETDLLEVIRGFLKDDVREWYIDNRHRLQYWDEGTDQRYSFVLKFVARFKTKAQVEVWHWKWDALKHEEEEDISEYATHFKKIYKQVDPQKRTLTRTVMCKFINSLPPKYVEMLTIMGPDTLDETIEAAMDIKASQRVKARKRDQAYMINI